MAAGRRAALVIRAAGEAASGRLAETYLRIFLARIAQGRGRASALEAERSAAAFASPVHALGAALRIRYDLAGLDDKLAPELRRRFRIGVGAGGEADAEALCARAEPGGICADDATVAAAAGRLDFESRDLGPLRPGAEARACAVAGTLTGRVFRYKPWTTPRRRRAALLAAGAGIAALALALAAEP